MPNVYFDFHMLDGIITGSLLRSEYRHVVIIKNQLKETRYKWARGKKIPTDERRAIAYDLS